MRLFLVAVAYVAVSYPVPGRADANVVLPTLSADLVTYYDFDHPDQEDSGREADQGRSATALELVNGGPKMRVADPAYPGAGNALQTRQINPGENGNDDWKAGVFDADGVATLDAFSEVTGITLMGWVKPTGRHPNLDSTTPDPADRFSAVGLFGILSGTSEGHLVRALLEVITLNDELRLVALGRREDTGESLLLAAIDDWEAIVPPDSWTHLAATFDFDEGTMVLYRNGEVLPATYTTRNDQWRVDGEPEPDVTAPSLPNGIKIGGSYPQNTLERNPFNGRFDDLMFFGRALSAGEARAQFARFHQSPLAQPVLQPD